MYIVRKTIRDNTMNAKESMMLYLMDIYDSDETLTKPQWAEILLTMRDVVLYEHNLELTDE